MAKVTPAGLATEGPPALRNEGGSRMRIVLRSVPTVLTFATLLGIWAGITYWGWVDPVILPTPWAVYEALLDVVTDPSFLPNLRITMTETLVGGAIGMTIGLLAGCIVGVSPAGRSILQPLMVTIQAVPALVLAPLMLIWFGYGIASKVALVILATFFPVFVTTLQGIRDTPESYMKLMTSLGATRLRTFLTLRFPYALPSIFAGVRASIASAFSAAVVTEFVGALNGLGVQVLIYNQTLQIPEVFALVLVMVVIGMLLYYVAELADRRVVFWRRR